MPCQAMRQVKPKKATVFKRTLFLVLPPSISSADLLSRLDKIEVSAIGRVLLKVFDKHPRQFRINFY
jgi:hypothetical protein